MPDMGSDVVPPSTRFRPNLRGQSGAIDLSIITDLFGEGPQGRARAVPEAGSMVKEPAAVTSNYTRNPVGVFVSNDGLSEFSYVRGGMEAKIQVGEKTMRYEIDFLDTERAGDRIQPQFRGVAQKLDDALIPSWELQFNAQKLALIRDTNVSADQAYTTTGLGNAKRVITTIAEAVAENIGSNELQVVLFSADRPSRQKAYEMMARRMANRLPNHSVYKISHEKGGQYAIINAQYRDRALKAIGDKRMKLIVGRED